MKPEDAKSRVDTAVPHPPAEHLSEEQKKALELSGDLEHEHGRKREELSRKASEAADASHS